MLLSEIQTEVQARVTATASVTRLNLWINAAYRKASEMESWPWLEATTTGNSPLTISDLRAVLAVTDTTNKNVLDFADFRDLNDDDPTLTTTGYPYCWYQSAPTVISTYPTTVTALSVRYLKVPTDLSAGTDVALIPPRYHYDILVEGACAYAYRDSDNWEAAQACQNVFDSAVLDMGDALNVINFDNARSMSVSGSSSTDW